MKETQSYPTLHSSIKTYNFTYLNDQQANNGTVFSTEMNLYSILMQVNMLFSTLVSWKQSNKTDRQFEYSFQIMLWKKHEYAECNKKIIKSKRLGTYGVLY